PLSQLSGRSLLVAAVLAVLGPAWIAGLVTGYLAPRVRWWQLVTLGVLAAAVFLAWTAFPRLGVSLPVPLRFWLAANLVFDFLIAGWFGHWCRLWRRPIA